MTTGVTDCFDMVEIAEGILEYLIRLANLQVVMRFYSMSASEKLVDIGIGVFGLI